MIPVASDVHKGRCWTLLDGDDSARGRREDAGTHRVHAGSVAAALAYHFQPIELAFSGARIYPASAAPAGSAAKTPLPSQAPL